MVAVMIIVQQYMHARTRTWANGFCTEKKSCKFKKTNPFIFKLPSLKFLRIRRIVSERKKVKLFTGQALRNEGCWQHL